MRSETRELYKIYKPMDRDWLNYKITQANPLTFHHIVKKEKGGLYTIDNGALLTNTSHQYLHLIEYKEYEIYVCLNKMLEIINRQRKLPNEEQREIIYYLLEQFYELHKEDTNSKGKSLIKYDYLKYRSM